MEIISREQTALDINYMLDLTTVDKTGFADEKQINEVFIP